MSSSIDGQATRARRFAIESGKIKPRHMEVVNFDLDRSLYEAGAAPASVASKTGGWARNAQAPGPHHVISEKTTSEVKSAVARVGENAPTRIPIFNRKVSSERQKRAPVAELSFLKRPRIRAKKASNPPTSNNLQQRMFKKWGQKICCCNCRKTVDKLLWQKHLRGSCSSLSVIRAEVRRAQKKALQIEREKADACAASGAALNPPKKTRCGKCGKMLSRMAMEIHVGSCGKVKRSQSPESFPFTLLPESISADFRHRVRNYFLSNQLSVERPFDRDWDWARMEELEKLNPKITHYGRRGWFGYCVCEFSDTKKVLLESPLRSSATYIVGANWRDLISLTKPEIREGNHQRIYHVGHYWRKRVTRAVVKQPIPVDLSCIS